MPASIETAPDLKVSDVKEEREKKCVEIRNLKDDETVEITKLLGNCQISKKEKSTECLKTPEESSDNGEIEKIGKDQKGDDLTESVCSDLSKVTLKDNDDLNFREVETFPEKPKPVDSKKGALSSRGPINATPSSYRPVQRTQEFCTGYPFQNPNLPAECSFTNNFDCFNGSGKRRQMGDDENPYKYRPDSGHSYNIMNTMNNCGMRPNIPPERLHMAGGTMSVSEQLVPDPTEINIESILDTFDECQGFSGDLGSEGYASESSPGHESQYSPPPSNMSYLSEDSGINSPDNRRSDMISPMSTVIPAPSPKLVGYPQASIPNQTSPNTNTSCLSNDKFFDEHKEDLCDLLKIITSELTQEEINKRMSQQVPPTNQKFVPNEQPIRRTQPPVQQQVVIPEPAPPQNTRNAAVNPNILPINQQAPVFTPPRNVQQVPPQTVPVTLPPAKGQAVPVTSVPFLIVPVSQTPPLVVVTSRPGDIQPQPQPQKKTPRPILPKLPEVAVADTKKDNIPNNLPTSVVALQPNVKEDKISNANRKKIQDKSKNFDSLKLNKARRLVADVKTEELKFQDSEGDTYLHRAVCQTDANLVKAFLERLERQNLQSLINVHNNRRQTPLYCAVSDNKPAMVELFVKYGADTNTLAERYLAGGGYEVIAAIHVAASNGEEYLDTLKALLLSPELNINTMNSDGQTALHCAVLCHGKNKNGSISDTIDSTKIIETLLNNNAELNTQEQKSGKTPLMYALESKNLHLIQSLVKGIKRENMRKHLATSSFNGNTAQKILEALKTSVDHVTWTKIHSMVTCTEREPMKFQGKPVMCK